MIRENAEYAPRRAVYINRARALAIIEVIAIFFHHETNILILYGEHIKHLVETTI